MDVVPNRLSSVRAPPMKLSSAERRAAPRNGTLLQHADGIEAQLVQELPHAAAPHRSCAAASTRRRRGDQRTACASAAAARCARSPALARCRPLRCETAACAATSIARRDAEPERAIDQQQSARASGSRVLRSVDRPVAHGPRDRSRAERIDQRARSCRTGCRCVSAPAIGHSDEEAIAPRNTTSRRRVVTASSAQQRADEDQVRNDRARRTPTGTARARTDRGAPDRATA